MNSIVKLAINEDRLLQSEQFRQERHRAVTDFISKNNISFKQDKGPFHATVAIADHKFVLQLLKMDSTTQEILSIPLSPLKGIVRDYRIVCESYVQAVQYADPTKVEAIDMGRRSLHNEGAEQIQALLPVDVEADFETLRKLFTLIYVLQLR